VRLAKNKLWFGFRFCLPKNCGLRFGFGFTIFGSVRSTFVCQCRCHLSFTPLRYDTRNNVLPCWIGPTNCQPKWLRTRSAEMPHEEKYFNCWSYHATRWTVNEATWKTVPKPPKSVFENRTAETEFSVFEFWGRFGSVFRKPISDIFIGFRIRLQHSRLGFVIVVVCCVCYLLLPPVKARGYVFRSVCLSVCLPVDYSKSYEWISIKYFGWMRRGPRTKWLDLGGYLDHSLVQEFLLLTRCS